MKTISQLNTLTFNIVPFLVATKLLTIIDSWNHCSMNLKEVPEAFSLINVQALA